MQSWRCSIVRKYRPAVMVMLLWLLLCLATAPLCVVSRPARAEGRHVCSYVCGVETYRELYQEKYTTRCGWWPWRKACTGYRDRYRIQYRDVLCYRCCAGWKKGADSDECLIPSDKGCLPIACDSSNSEWDCWGCCDGWGGHDCRKDIDECAVDNGGCSHICDNTAGSYHCDCNDGYQLDPFDPFRSSCIDKVECEVNNGGCEHQCFNSPGSFNCDCHTGYKLEPATLQCKDKNECEEANGGCSDTCVNTVGSFYCDCPSGYKVDTSGFSCEEIDPCKHQNGQCDHICVKVVGSYYCECGGGYILAPDGLACKDIDECADNNGNCSDKCVNGQGSYECRCANGYILDGTGFNCSDIIECLSGNGNCSDTCINTVGSFYCECPNGFALDNSERQCQDIDECSEQTDNCQQICRNTIGSFECSCKSGYEKHGTGCTDIDECINLNGGCSDTCVNTIGSYMCECPDGWQVGKGNLQCTDADECQMNNGGCQQRCINTQGRFYCDCHLGYYYDDQDHHCRDVNECNTVNGGCQEECRNTNGSFFCSCPNGYVLTENGRGCEDIDECSLDEGLCQHLCQNTAGSYVCNCMDGYKQQGEDCTDIDECLENVCQYSCTNSAGSFLCGCPDGMFLDTNGITCSGEDLCAKDHDCQQICNSERNSLFCSCLSGYELINSEDCIDIDECSRSADGCSHECSNTNGSYVCQCPVGLQIDSDTRTCLGPCSPNPCLHEGECVRGESGAVCECSGTSYTGDICQHGIVNVSFDGHVYKGREASMIFVAKPDSSLEIEVNVLGSKAKVTPLKASIVYPSKKATVKIKGLEAGFETLHFSLSGIAASQYVEPEGMTVYVHDVFSRNNITDFTLPTGSYGLEANLQDKIDVVLTSTTPWYSLVRDPDIMFTLGIVHMEAGGLKVPVSFRGTELRKGDLPRPVSSFRIEEDGNIVQSRRQRRSSVQSLLKEDIEDLWAHNAIFRTALKLLRPHLPSWLSLEICGDPVYDVIPRTDIMPGLQTKGVPSCSGAPVFDDHLYVVIEIRTDLCIGILDNDITLDASSEGYVCLLVDLDNVPGSTIIIMLPEDSSEVLQQLKLFSTIKENYGVTINIKGLGFSLANGLNVKDYKFSRTYWVGDRYFTIPAINDASVWLDVSGEYEKQFGMMELRGAGQLELALTAPDLVKLVTHPLVDRTRFHFGFRAGVLDVFFNIKKFMRIHLQPKLDLELMAYAAVGGGEAFAQEKCGPDPAGIFISCHLAVNPFNIPILPFLDLSVPASVFATTDVTVMKRLVIPPEIETAIEQMRYMILDLIAQLEVRFQSLEGVVAKYVDEVIGLLRTQTEKIEVIMSGLVQNVYENNVASLLDTFTRLVTGVRSVLEEIKDIVGALAHNVEAHAFGIVDDVETFVVNVLNLLSETQWLTVQYAISAQGGVTGFGVQVSGTLKVFTLEFSGLDIEFVYSDGHLGYCGRFNKKFSLLQGQDAFRILSVVRNADNKFRFFRLMKGAGIELAYGLDTNDVVVAFRAKWSFLGFTVEADTYVSKKYVGANMVAKVYNLFMIETEVHASIIEDMKLMVRASFLPGPDGFDGSLKDAIYLASNNLADAAAKRLSQLQEGLDAAQRALQKGIDWLDRRQDQVDDLHRVFDKAVERLRDARRKVGDLQKPVDRAMAKVREAERKLDRLCKIRKCGSLRIPGLRCRWCKKRWLGYPCCSWTRSMVRIPDVVCHLKNLACMTVRALAFVALQIAKVGLYIARISLANANIILRGVEFIVDKSRIVLEVAKGVLELAKVSLRTLQAAAEVAKVALEVAKHLLRGALKLAAFLLDVLLPVDVKRCGFEVELSTKDLFVFGIDCEINLFNTGWIDIKFKINIGDFGESLRNIARQLIKKFASWLGIGRRKREISSGEADDSTGTFWENTSGNFTDEFGKNRSKIMLDEMDFAEWLTQDEIKIADYAQRCRNYEGIAQFLSTAVDALFEVANETKATVEEMEIAVDSLEGMTYTNTTNITLEDAGIDVDEASREYNLTRYEMEAAVNESTGNITESEMYHEVSKVSSWNQDLLKTQMEDIKEYPLIPVWKEAMENITREYFDEEVCMTFFDCVIVSFINLHMLYDGFHLPGCNETREMIRDLEQQFVSVMLHSDTATLEEAYTFSHDVLELLEKMNDTKVFCASPPSIVTNPLNASVLIDRAFQLTCEATADPEPAYSWMRNGKKLDDYDQNRLTIEAASKSDAGDYVCVASNHMASDLSEPARVIVEWMPEMLFVSRSEDLLTGLPDGVTLLCNVSASPEANITWYKQEGATVDKPLVSMMQNATEIEYHISSPLKSDSGNYWCKAENVHGIATSNTIVLTVRHVTSSLITTSISVGFFVTRGAGSYSGDLERNITEAVKQDIGLGSSVVLNWNEPGQSGALSIQIILGNYTTDETTSQKLLKTLHRNNMDRSLTVIGQITSAAYAERIVLRSECCTVVYDPAQLSIDGPHSKCPHLYTAIGDRLCAEAEEQLVDETTSLPADRRTTTLPAAQNTDENTATPHSNVSSSDGIQPWVFAVGIVAGIVIVGMISVTGWCMYRRKTKKT